MSDNENKNEITEIKLSMVELKAGVIEHLKFSLNNLHEHVKEQGASTRKILNCVKNDIEELKKNVVTKEELKQVLIEYVEVDKCKLYHSENDKKYVKRAELWKWVTLFLLGMSSIWAIIKVLFPLLKQIM